MATPRGVDKGTAWSRNRRRFVSLGWQMAVLQIAGVEGQEKRRPPHTLGKASYDLQEEADCWWGLFTFVWGLGSIAGPKLRTDVEGIFHCGWSEQGGKTKGTVRFTMLR
eukprot:c10047_g1_i1 orf=73-399(+)